MFNVIFAFDNIVITLLDTELKNSNSYIYKVSVSSK